MARVIAVAGAPGAGKSSLVRALAAALPGASVVHFDHYERMTTQPIEDVRRWMAAGADIDKLPLPGLAEALGELKGGRMVIDPVTRAPIAPAELILFETQFGRRHSESGKYIDFLAWIDLPLDLALARKVRQMASGAGSGDTGFAPWLEGYMGNYLDVVGALLRQQREKVASQAELTVDGRLAPDSQARCVLEAIGAAP